LKPKNVWGEEVLYYNQNDQISSAYRNWSAEAPVYQSGSFLDYASNSNGIIETGFLTRPSIVRFNAPIWNLSGTVLTTYNNCPSSGSEIFVLSGVRVRRTPQDVTFLKTLKDRLKNPQTYGAHPWGRSLSARKAVFSSQARTFATDF